MKRKLAFILLISLLISSTFVFGISATDTLTLTHNLDSGIKKANNTGCIALEEGTSRIGDSGKGVLIKANATANSDPNHDYTRHSLLFNIDNNIIPVGTYTVSIWVRHNVAATGSDWSVNNAKIKGFIALNFYGIEITDDNATKSNGTSLTLYPGTNNGDFKFDEADESTHIVSNTKDWYKYTATLTLDQPCKSMAFYVVNNTDSKETNTWTTALDNLEITGTPEVQNEDIKFRGIQDTDADSGYFNMRMVSTLNSLDFDSVGYNVTVETTEGKFQKTVQGTEVYESITGENTLGNSLTYKASYYNTQYICAWTVTELPATGTVTITITPFAGQTTGTAYTAIYTNGVFVSLTEVVQ